MERRDLLCNFAVLAHEPYLAFINNLDRATDNVVKTLVMLRDNGQLTAGQISEALDIKPSSVTQIIKKLEIAGAAVRIKSEEDSRVTFVQITDTGRTALKTHKNASTEIIREVFKGFSDEDINQFNTYLERLRDNVNDERFRECITEILSDKSRWEGFDSLSAQFGRAREMMLTHATLEHYMNDAMKNRS